MVLAAGAAVTADASALENIITNPKLNLEIRPRYEYADVDDNGKDAGEAFTVRTALGMQAGLFGVEGLSTELQMIDVSNFGWLDDYNDLAGDPEPYDVIADPTQTRVTQAYVAYANNGLTLLGGRKMVVLDNARFIGNVGWRQMPQTYDLGAVVYNGIENLSLLGAYVTQVNTVLKDGKIDTGSVLLHGAYQYAPALKITLYDYMIQDFADHIGISFTGNVDYSDMKFKYEAEYAKQNDPSITDEVDDLDQDADYYKLGLDMNYAGFIVGAAYELLGEANGGAMEFYTPLATLHAHNGWADVFLKGTGTPYGLEDLSFKLGYNAGEYGKLIGIYHQFQSDAASYDYGSEIDVAYSYKINKNLGLLLKGAFFSGDDAVPESENPVLKNAYDVTKYWIQFDYKFSASL
jgi:hypothetical protein